MCAANKTKKGNKAFSYLFHTLIDHHICLGVRPLGCHVKNGNFVHQAWIACQRIALLRCSTILTKC